MVPAEWLLRSESARATAGGERRCVTGVGRRKLPVEAVTYHQHDELGEPNRDTFDQVDRTA